MIENTKLKFHIGEVLPYDNTYAYVKADEDDSTVETLNAIVVQTYTDYYNNETLLAVPANPNIKQIPLVGEHVLIFKTTNQESNGTLWREMWYYLPLVGIKTAINENRIIGISEKLSDIDVADRLSKETFKSKEISPLQQYEGDLLIEGRWGNSIRFSNTFTTNKNYTVDKSWKGNVEGDPILIISNGRKNLSNKQFVSENIQEDGASLYFTSTQQIPSFTLNNQLYQATSPGEYSYSQLIGTADRITLKAKNDHIILDSQIGIEINSPKIYLGSSRDKEPMLHTNAVVEILQKLVDICSTGFVDAGGKISTAVSTESLLGISSLMKQIKNYNVMVDKYKQ
jgi:hypothetical protein